MSKASLRILFIGPHRPNRNGSQRFRMEQYFPYLRQEGFTCDYSWFINEQDDRIFYSKGNFVRKGMLFLKAIMVRLRDVLRANNYDFIFIQREAFLAGSTFFEKRFSNSHAKVVFDFDDAIWLDDTSEGNTSFKWIKRPSKIFTIISMADAVIAGNDFLASYARRFSNNVVIIPTVVDTTVYLPGEKNNRQPICIGWSGSKTTIKHFGLIIPVLRMLKAKYQEKICFILIGDRDFHTAGLEIESIDWNFDSELNDLRKIDIGLMPLPDNDWSRGKCSFKAIQYMSLEIPPVVSPVGMNTQLITHGLNGFFAESDEDWLNRISELVESPELRKCIGSFARKTIEEKYSVIAQYGNFRSLLLQLKEQPGEAFTNL